MRRLNFFSAAPSPKQEDCLTTVVDRDRDGQPDH
jgi:hypothetical protein